MKREENNQEQMIRYLTGSLTKKEEAEFIAWLEADTANKAAFDDLRTIWLAGKRTHNPDEFDSGSAYNFFLKKINKSQSVLPAGRHSTIFSIFFRVAAVLAISYSIWNISASLIKFHKNNNSLAYQEIRVPLGSKSSIILPDQTRVTLNAGSVLKYAVDFGKASREVELTGEAYFDVARNLQKTFIVNTGLINIKALGTEFNVKAYPEEKIIETTLVSGLLQVEKIDPHTKKAAAETSVIMEPKQRLTFYKETENFDMNTDQDEPQLAEIAKEDLLKETVREKRMLLEKNVDVMPNVSWKDTRWIFYREELEQLAVKLERRYDVVIVFRDEELKSFRFNGTLANESVEQVLRAMSLTAPIEFEIEGKTIVFKENKEFRKKYRDLFR